MVEEGLQQQQKEQKKGSNSSSGKCDPYVRRRCHKSGNKNEIKKEIFLEDAKEAEKK